MDCELDLKPLDFSFVPHPGRRDAPDADIWLAANFSVYTPALLDASLAEAGPYDRDFELDQNSISFLAALTARINYVCRGHWTRSSGLRATPASAKAAEAALSAGVPSTRGILDWALALARKTDHGGVRRRSDHAWIGGSGPTTAWLALPRADVLDELLSNLEQFLSSRPDGRAGRAFFEAVAYQMICIHALSDANGRTTRALLTNLAVRHQNIYPLYVAHCLSFAKERAGHTWLSASVAGRAGSHESQSTAWLRQMKHILEAIHALTAAGLDRRAVWSLLICGYVSHETLCSGRSGCSRSLASKIMDRLSAVLTEEQGCFYSKELEMLTIGIDHSINKDRHENN